MCKYGQCGDLLRYRQPRFLHLDSDWTSPQADTMLPLEGKARISSFEQTWLNDVEWQTLHAVLPRTVVYTGLHYPSSTALKLPLQLALFTLCLFLAPGHAVQATASRGRALSFN